MNKIEWLQQLIAFDTTSRLTNLPLIEFLANRFDELQIPVNLIHDRCEPKANLLATLPAKNGSRTGGLILSGHTDVVPVDGQIWDTDPFTAVVKDECVYGRGACDMKGFIAVVMSLLPKFKEMSLDFPIHFAFSYDEEIGCTGVPSLINKLVADNYNPRACVVGEPTSMQTVIGHKGKYTYRCKVHGLAAHSSLTDQGCNAIEHSASFISWLRSTAAQFKERGLKDIAYDVPYTTLTTTLINGGNAQNTIPSLCEFYFEFRNLPEENAGALHQKILEHANSELLSALLADSPKAKLELDVISKAPGLTISASEPLVRAALQLTPSKELAKAAYATEAGLFQEVGIPSIVCGPGSVLQAHRANEFVSIEQLEQCHNFLCELMAKSFY